VVQEQEYNWQNSRVKWDSSSLVGDVSEEQDMFNGVVVNVKMKVWHIDLRKLRFMLNVPGIEKAAIPCGTVTWRRHTIFGHNAIIVVLSPLGDRRR
jgi:hypothetical protein